MRIYNLEGFIVEKQEALSFDVVMKSFFTKEKRCADFLNAALFDGGVDRANWFRTSIDWMMNQRSRRFCCHKIKRDFISACIGRSRNLLFIKLLPFLNPMLQSDQSCNMTFTGSFHILIRFSGTISGSI